MKKIVLFQMNQLGDLLFSLPVIKAIRENSKIEIYSVIKPAFAPILLSAGLINGTIDKQKSFFDLVKDLKSHNFDTALLFSESPSSLLSAYFAGIKHRFGFDSASLSFLLTQKAQKTGVPSIINNHRLGIKAGLTNIKEDYTDIIVIPDENIQNVQKWFNDKRINPKNTIALSPGSAKKKE